MRCQQEYGGGGRRRWIVQSRIAQCASQPDSAR